MLVRSLSLALALALPFAALAQSRSHKTVRPEDRQMYAHPYRAPVAAVREQPFFAPAAPQPDSRDPLAASANGS